MKSHINIKSGISILASVLLLIMFSGDIYGQQKNLNFSSEDYYLSSNLYEQKISYDYDIFEPKSPAVAFILSAGTTTGSFLTGYYLMKNDNYDTGRWFIIGGTLFGPSVGNMYASNFKAVRNGVLIRLGGAAISVIGTMLVLEEAFGSVFHDKEQDQVKVGAGTVLFFTGIGVICSSIFYDISTAANNVKKYNQKNQKQLTLAPAYDPVSGSIGFNLNLKF